MSRPGLWIVSFLLMLIATMTAIFHGNNWTGLVLFAASSAGVFAEKAKQA